MKGKDSFYTKYIKRVLDIFFSSIALLVLGIPMLIVALLIKIDMGSPVLFKQDRIGKDEKKFTLLKFRSMKDAFDQYGVPLPDEKRITKLGKIIRKLSVDELPSLLNIWLGQMSIIGPRPLPWNYKPWFTKEERKRHSIRGGLSGLAQVNGRSALSWEQKFAYDLKYVEEMSFLLDAEIVVQTIIKTLEKKDIGNRGTNATPDFHCMRSGLSERELLEMEKEGRLPYSLETYKGRNYSDKEV